MTLESDGIIEVWDIDTGRTIAQYEGIEVHDAMQSIAQLRAQIAERDATIAQLRAQLDAVPVAQLRRQYSVEPMTVHDFGLDAQDVAAWLRSLDGDA